MKKYSKLFIALLIQVIITKVNAQNTVYDNGY